MNHFNQLLCCTFALVGCLHPAAYSQDKVPAGSFALVNSVSLPSSLFEQVIKNNVTQGAKETPEMRNVVRSELIARSALSQEAIKLGLDKQDKTMLQMELMKQNLLSEFLIEDHLTKNPITEAEIRADFDRQVTLLKDAKEFKIRDIVLPDEASAKLVLANVRKGESFEKIAKEKSMDISKSEGGDLGWLLAEQIDPLVSNVVLNLSKGAVAAAPIKIQNTWHIIKLEDIRNFLPPKFDETKLQIRQALVLKQRNEFINKVLSNAKVQLAN